MGDLARREPSDLVPAPGEPPAEPPEPRSGLRATDWIKLCLAGALILSGAGAVVVGGRTDLDAVRIQQEWATSDDARLAEREATADQPIWLPIATSQPPTRPQATIEPLATVSRQPPTPTALVPVLLPTLSPPPRLAPTLAPVSLDLLQVEFQFLDPPEPGARARLSLDVRNNFNAPALPIAIALPARWMAGFSVSDTAPPLVRKGAGPDGQYRIAFASLAPGATRVEINLVATAEGIDAPTVILEVAAGDPPGAQPGMGLWRGKPTVVAPKPRPGPVMALRIPKLGLNSPVVPTSWEPPAFVIGEISGSAPITEGNTVLVGHLTGAAGAVFAHLEDLEPGDELVAVSRGLEYPLVVTDAFVQPQDDIDAAQPGGPPRLTLVTCSGDWDPLTRNYSDRLWVVAEPPAEASPPTPTPATQPTTPPTPIPTATPRPVRRTNGLGDSPAVFSTLYGPPLRQVAPNVAEFQSDGLDYEVRYSSSQRADTIAISASGGASMSLQTAVQAAHGLFPQDAYSRIAGTDLSNGLVIERMTSAALPGDFVAAFERQPDGTVRRVIVSMGNTSQDPAPPTPSSSPAIGVPSPSPAPTLKPRG